MVLKSSFLIVLLISCSMTVSYGYFQPTGSDPRSGGLGEAFTAIADDINALFYNPAGLIQIETFQLSGIYAQYYAGLYPRLWNGSFDRTGYNIVAFALPLPSLNGTFGFGWKQFDTQLYKENSFVFGWGTSIGDLSFAGEESLIDVGVNVKVLRIDIDADLSTYPDVSNQKIGTTADLGVLFHYSDDLHIGLAVDNVIPVNMGLVDEEIIKPIVRIGTAYYLPLETNWLESLVASFELTVRDDLSDDIVEYKFGSEAYFFNGLLALRAGLTEYRFTTGAGFRYEKEIIPLGFQIDYAFSYPFNIVGTAGSHRIGMTINWDASTLDEMEGQRTINKRNQLVLIADDKIGNMQGVFIKKKDDVYIEKRRLKEFYNTTQQRCAQYTRKLDEHIQSIKQAVTEAMELKKLMKEMDGYFEVQEMINIFPDLDAKIMQKAKAIDLLFVAINETISEVENERINTIYVGIDQEFLEFSDNKLNLSRFDQHFKSALKKISGKDIQLQVVDVTEMANRFRNGELDLVVVMNPKMHHKLSRQSTFNKVCKIKHKTIKSNNIYTYVVDEGGSDTKAELVGKAVGYLSNNGFNSELQQYLKRNDFFKNANEIQSLEEAISSLKYITIDALVATGTIEENEYVKQNCRKLDEGYPIKQAFLYKHASSSEKLKILNKIIEMLITNTIASGIGFELTKEEKR